MLDIRRIREDLERLSQAVASKGVQPDWTAVLELDQRRRDRLQDVEGLKNQRNTASKEIGRLKKAGEDIREQQEAMRAVGEQIGAMDQEIRDLDLGLRELLLAIPNAPHASAPVGADAAGNVFVRSWGEQRTFDFKPQPHWDIGERLSLFDLDRGAKLSGAGFPLFTGQGARLERALINFMLDVHTREHGYTEVATPILVNADAMTGTGQLPKLADDMYRMDADNLWLIPTAEVPVTNIFREEIMDRELPVCLTAYTPCFRREAGAAGRDTRGLIRVHQFDKVEMVKFVEPETSYDELEKLVSDAEDILQRLDLPYRVRELCTGDLSFAAAKCYDIELWAPGYDGWLEVSSCSNFEDFQARRAGIRFRNKQGKPAFVHTLNGSGTALPRLVVAILENNQQADGSVVLPEAIRPYMDGVSVLEPISE